MIIDTTAYCNKVNIWFSTQIIAISWRLLTTSYWRLNVATVSCVCFMQNLSRRNRRLLFSHRFRSRHTQCVSRIVVFLISSEKISRSIEEKFFGPNFLSASVRSFRKTFLSSTNSYRQILRFVLWHNLPFLSFVIRGPSSNLSCNRRMMMKFCTKKMINEQNFNCRTMIQKKISIYFSRYKLLQNGQFISFFGWFLKEKKNF